MKNTFIDNLKYYHDCFLFGLVLLAGIFTKIYLAIQRGKKPTLSWFLAEAVVSFFVAISVYAFFDQFLHLNKMITYVICAWGGSKSTLINREVEEIIDLLFDSLKTVIKSKSNQK